MTTRDADDGLGSEEMISLLLERVHAFAPHYTRRHTSSGYVGLEKGGKPDNFVVFRPRGYGLRMDVKLGPDDPIVRALEEVGVEVFDHRPYGSGPGFHPIRVTPGNLLEHLSLFGLLLQRAYRSSSRYS